MASLTSTSATSTATMTTTTHRCNSCNRHNCRACNSINPNPNQLHDDYGLSSPHFQRLITNYTSSSSSSSSSSNQPTVKSIRITPSFLATDPTILCAICKDQFLTNDQTKQLPCKHIYHSQCILPWLSNHTSCPLCRFQLPQHLVDATLGIKDHEEVALDDETMLRIGFDNLDHQMYLQPLFHVRSRNVVFPFHQQQQVIREVDDFQLFMDDERERVLPNSDPISGVDDGNQHHWWDVWAESPFGL